MKTLQECKDEVAIGRGYDSFNDFSRRQNFRLKIKVAHAIERLMEEAAELYASQFEQQLSALQQENADKTLSLQVANQSIDCLSSDVNRLQQENQTLKVDRDEKEVMIAAFDKVQKLFQSYTWIIQGRGPYTFDDDRYRKEVGNLYEEFEEIKGNTFDSIKTKTEDYRQALMKYGFDHENQMLKLKVEGLQQENEKLRKFKEYVHERLDDMGVPADPEPENNAKHGCRIEGRLNFLQKKTLGWI